MVLACAGLMVYAAPSIAGQDEPGSLGGVVVLDPGADGSYSIPYTGGRFLRLEFDLGDSGFQVARVQVDMERHVLELRFRYLGEKPATAFAAELTSVSTTGGTLSSATLTEDWSSTVEYKDGELREFTQGIVHERGVLLPEQVHDVKGFGVPARWPEDAPSLTRLVVTVPVVVFADTSFAGSPRLARQILGARKAAAEELAYWTARLDEVVEHAASNEEAVAGVKRLLAELESDVSGLPAAAQTVRANLRSNLDGYVSGAKLRPKSAQAELRSLAEWLGEELDVKLKQVPSELPEVAEPTQDENRLEERLVGEGDPNDPPYCDCGGGISASVAQTQSRICDGSATGWHVNETWSYACLSDDQTGGTTSGTGSLAGVGGCIEGAPCIPDTYCPPMFTPVSITEDLDYHYWNRSATDQSLLLGLLCTARCSSGASRSLTLKCPCSPRPEPNCRIDGCPILIETGAAGFRLTDLAGGVRFDLDADGTPERLSWPVAGTDDAWLALDRDGSGTIDNGLELFGDATPQPPSSEPNGFLALAVFDRPEEGGDGDGQITAADRVFADLRLWLDRNHDGTSDPSELTTLPEAGIVALELEYHESRHRDRHGNEFRYSAGVWHANGARRLAQDVFLIND